MSKLSLHLKYFGVLMTIGMMMNRLRLRVLQMRGIRFYQKNLDGFNLIIDLSDPGISKELFLAATREKEHIILLKQILKPGNRVLDLGANIGYYTSLMGQLVGPHGKVFSVEPSPANFRQLSINIDLNNLWDRVEIFHFGIGNETGTSKFYLSEKSNWHTFEPKANHNSNSEDFTSSEYINAIDMKIVSIGDFLGEHGDVDLIRMDIEGFEVEVLDGLVEYLDKNPDVNRPKILFEVHQPRYHEEHDFRKVLSNLFKKTDYFAHTLVSNMNDLGGSEYFSKLGYTSSSLVRTDYMERGLYSNVASEDAVELCCQDDFVRAALLCPNSTTGLS